MVPRPWTYQGSGISLYEVNPPTVIAVVVIHQGARHGGIVGRLAACASALVVDGNWSARGCVFLQLQLDRITFAHAEK
jgi:hypothetical protein